MRRLALRVAALLLGIAVLLLGIARTVSRHSCPSQPADGGFDHQLTVCTLTHEESRYLPEWIEFHRLQGVDHFVVYDDDSAAPARNLEGYIADGVVELHVVNSTLETACASHPEDPSFYKLYDCQRALFRRCLDAHAHRTRWLGIFDVDEFLFAPLQAGRNGSDTLLRVLDAHPRASGFRFRGAVFGTSGLEHEPGNAPGLAVPMLTPLLTHRQALSDVPPELVPYFWAHKQIANPRHVAAPAVHWFEYKRCAGAFVDFDVAADAPGRPQSVLMFHMQYRSRESAARKAKLNVNKEVSFHADRDALFNAVRDERAAAYAPEVAAALQMLFPARSGDG